MVLWNREGVVLCESWQSSMRVVLCGSMTRYIAGTKGYATDSKAVNTNVSHSVSTFERFN